MSIEQRLALCLESLARLEQEWSGSADLPASPAQIQLLLWVGQHPGCRLQHIAAGLGLTAPTVSVGVRRMEQMGLLERAADGSDQRAISLMLSPTGQLLYELAVSARMRQIQALTSRLNPAEQRQLAGLLERILGLQPPAADHAADGQPRRGGSDPPDQSGPAQLTFLSSG